MEEDIIMNKARIFFAFLALVLTPVMLFAGGSAEKSATSGSYKKVVYAYATFNNIPNSQALASVEDAINKITRPSIGAEIVLKPIPIFSYTSKVSLQLQSGEQIDAFQSLGNFPNAVAQGMAYDLTDIAKTDAAATLKMLPKEWLAAETVNGRLYGLPTYKPLALTPMIVYRKDIASALGLDMSSVTSIDQLPAILEKVKAAHPTMTPMAAVSAGDIGLLQTIKDIDYLGDSWVNPMGVLIGDNLHVVNLYDTPEFRHIVDLARKMYTEGLIMKDAATTTSTAADLMSSGNYFCFVAAYSYPEKDTAASLEPQSGGYPLGAKRIGNAYLSTSDINQLTWMVSSTSKVPNAALKFLNLTFTNKDIVNLLIYGVKGVDYVLNSDGTAGYPKGQDASTVPYTAQLSVGTLGNFFNMYPMTGTNPDSLKWELEQNVKAKTSPAMGFNFNSSKTKNQYTAVINVIKQYLPGLETGSLDPATALPEFLTSLKQAGLGTIIAEKQKQLDAWAQSK